MPGDLLPGLSLPGLTSLPPMDFHSSSSASIDQRGASFMVDSGAWNVTVGGSGVVASGTASASNAPGGVASAAGLSPLLLIVISGAALWLLKKH
jgi:hypothetical protein